MDKFELALHCIDRKIKVCLLCFRETRRCRTTSEGKGAETRKPGGGNVRQCLGRNFHVFRLRDKDNTDDEYKHVRCWHSLVARVQLLTVLDYHCRS